MRQKKKPQRFKTVGQPQSQMLTTTVERLRRRVGFGPRFTFELGVRIGDDLTVIGHLSAGRIAELYQVWSGSYLCALTRKILLPKLSPCLQEVRGLKREARLLKRLTHPNIVHLFAHGTYEGRDLLVQEYLHGPS